MLLFHLLGFPSGMFVLGAWAGLVLMFACLLLGLGPGLFVSVINVTVTVNIFFVCCYTAELNTGFAAVDCVAVESLGYLMELRNCFDLVPYHGWLQ